MSESLKNCPFCGGPAEKYVSTYGDSTKEYYTAYCSTGKCGVHTDPYDTWKEAVEVWNRRAGEEKAEEWDAFRSYVDLKTEHEVLKVSMGVLQRRIDALGKAELPDDSSAGLACIVAVHRTQIAALLKRVTIVEATIEAIEEDFGPTDLRDPLTSLLLRHDALVSAMDGLTQRVWALEGGVQ